jgi:hypothetical protein
MGRWLVKGLRGAEFRAQRDDCLWSIELLCLAICRTAVDNSSCIYYLPGYRLAGDALGSKGVSLADANVPLAPVEMREYGFRALFEELSLPPVFYFERGDRSAPPLG